MKKQHGAKNAHTEQIKWVEKEYREWIKSGWKKERGKKATEYVDFVQYLKNKYK